MSEATAHGRGWPLYGRRAYALKVTGQIDKSDLYDPRALERSLAVLLEPYGVTVRLEPTVVVSMSPEDQREVFALDEQAVRCEGFE